jgi:hypothetical protein
LGAGPSPDHAATPVVNSHRSANCSRPAPGGGVADADP